MPDDRSFDVLKFSRRQVSKIALAASLPASLGMLRGTAAAPELNAATADYDAVIPRPSEASNVIPDKATAPVRAAGWTPEPTTGNLPDGARSFILRHDGTDWEAHLGRHVNVLFFDVDPTGANDSAPGINAALVEAASYSGGGPLPVVLGVGTSRSTFTILSPIVMPQSATLIGTGQRGWRSEITFSGESLTDSAITTDPHSPRSGFSVQGIRPIDGRTDPARTGNGINADRARDYIHIADCTVQRFYDNYFIGSLESGFNGDRGVITRCWSTAPLRYGVRIWRLRNHFSI